MSTIYKKAVAPISGCLCFMAIGLLFGWPSPILSQLLKPDSIIPITPDESSWIVVCLELGNIVTAIPTGFILDKIGRKKCMLLCCPLIILSWLLVIFTRSVTVLYITRLLQGGWMGILFCVIPIYISEISQPSIRGILCTTVVAMWYVGFILAYIVGSYMTYEQTAYISLGLSVLYVVPLSLQPDTPYYYVLRKRMTDATRSLSYYRDIEETHTDKLREEIKLIEEYIKEEKSNKTSVLSLFTDPISLRCLFVVETICFATIFTGLTVTYAYATQIFSTVSQETFSAEQYSILISVLFLLTNFISIALIDRLGRRLLVIISCTGCFVSNFCACIYFYINSETDIDVTSLHWIPLVVVGSYCIFVSIGLSPLASFFQGEIFPSNTRSFASGFTACSISVMSASCLKIFFLIDTYIGLYCSYVMFTLSAGIGGVLLYIYMPETKDKTFAQIQKDLNKRYKKILVKDIDLLEPINR